METKQCKKCQETKTLDQFYKANYNYKNNQDGYDYYCKYCRKGSHLNSIRTNKKQCSLDDCNKPHYAKELCRMHYARKARHGRTESKNKPVEKDRNYQYDDIKTIYRRNWMLKNSYKISLDEFNKRAANGCEICGNKPERNLHVDHNHSCCNGAKSCGKCVRGIICNRCNMAVDKMETGVMRPDYPQYELIKQYLEAYSG